jgi:Nickel insertion protein
VKVARDQTGRIIQIKPEYEDARTLAEKTDRPLREVLRLIQTGAWNDLAGEDPGDSGQHQAEEGPGGRPLRRPG